MFHPPVLLVPRYRSPARSVPRGKLLWKIPKGPLKILKEGDTQHKPFNFFPKTNTPSIATDPSGCRCSVVFFLLPSTSSSPLLLASSSVVFVRSLSPYDIRLLPVYPTRAFRAVFRLSAVFFVHPLFHSPYILCLHIFSYQPYFVLDIRPTSVIRKSDIFSPDQ